MSHYHLIGQLPHHQYVHVDTAFTHRTPETPSIPAIWFGLVSYPGRALGCTVLLENAAVYRNLPLHSLAHTLEGLSIPWGPQDAQHWDCYSSGFTTLAYDTLSGLACLAKTAPGEQREGAYLCTIAPMGDAYSAVPAQAKELVLVALHNGRYTLQPTDRVVFCDQSFTTGDGFPRGLRRQDETYSAEGEPPIRTQGMSRADSRRAFKDAIKGDDQ
jgi:hypothetical protein